MGAIGGGIWHGIKGARNSPRVREKSTDLKTLTYGKPVGRTVSWRCFSDQSSSARNGRELRRVGRHVLIVRLCGEGMATEGRCMELDSFWIYDRRVFGCSKCVNSTV